MLPATLPDFGPRWSCQAPFCSWDGSDHLLEVVTPPPCNEGFVGCNPTWSLRAKVQIFTFLSSFPPDLMGLLFLFWFCWIQKSSSKCLSVNKRGRIWTPQV